MGTDIKEKVDDVRKDIKEKIKDVEKKAKEELEKEAMKTLKDFRDAGKDAEGFFSKHKTAVVTCGIAALIVIAALIYVF